MATAQHLHQLLVDDVDDLLHGSEALRNLSPQRLLLDRLDELADHLVVDVRFQEGQADLAEGLVQVLIRDGAVVAKAAEDPAQLIG